MVKYIIGIDPGINECSYCIIDEHKNIVDAALIPNSYNKPGKVNKLEKITDMAIELKKTLQDLGPFDLAAIETTIAFADGFRNIDTIARLAFASGSALGSLDSTLFVTAMPQQWKMVSNKEQNAELYLERLSIRQIGQLEILLRQYKLDKQHNILDALGIALWALENYKEEL